MNNLTKHILIICLLFFFCGFNSYKVNCQQYNYFQIDSAISAKFEGKPVKTFCHSALGDVTSFKYESNNNSKKTNYICEISIYKNIKSVPLDTKNADFLKFIVSSEEMSILEQNGKILEKKDSAILSHPGLLYKVYFQKIKDEKSKGWINHILYFKHNDNVIKLSTFVPKKSDGSITKAFFSSVKINP